MARARSSIRSPARPGATIVHAEGNRGKGHAVRLGLAKSRGTVVAIQDADLEPIRPNSASLVTPILSGDADVVDGSRFLAARPNAR